MRTEMHMGTLVSIRIDGLAYETAQPHLDAAFAAVRAVDDRFSNYKPESELSRLNATAWTGPQPVSADMSRLMERAMYWGQMTNGAFDCTVGPLVRVWGFFKREGRLPAPDELAEARAHTGWQHIAYDPKAHTLAFDHQGVELDFGAIAKGYAVDRALDVLRARGVTSALVDASGNFAALGHPDGRERWRIGIRHPLEPDTIIADLDFAEQGIATSGGYENYFEANGKRYVHIFDPRTGYPVQGMLSASVITTNATDADALSTSCFVLGIEDSLKLIESLPDTECLLVSGDPNDAATLRVRMSSGLEGVVRLHVQSDPG